MTCPLSLFGSSEKLNIALAYNFDKIEGAYFETNTEPARDMIENTKLDSEEEIKSLNVENLYTNVPLNEAIDNALKH